METIISRKFPLVKSDRPHQAPKMMQKLNFGPSINILDLVYMVVSDFLACRKCAMVPKSVRMYGGQLGNVKMKLNIPELVKVSSQYYIFQLKNGYQQIKQVILMLSLVDLIEDNGAVTTEMLSWGRDEKELSFANCGTLTTVDLISSEEFCDVSGNLIEVARRIIIA